MMAYAEVLHIFAKKNIQYKKASTFILVVSAENMQNLKLAPRITNKPLRFRNYKGEQTSFGGVDSGTVKGCIPACRTWINVDNRCPYLVENVGATWKVCSTDNVSAACRKTGWYFRMGSSWILISLNHTSLRIPADSFKVSKDNNKSPNASE